MGPFTKYVTCIMEFFIPFTLVSHFLSFTLSGQLRYSPITNYGKRKKRFSVYMAVSPYHIVSKEVENRIFKHNCIFRHTCMYKQPILTKKKFFLFRFYVEKQLSLQKKVGGARASSTCTPKCLRPLYRLMRESKILNSFLLT